MNAGSNWRSRYEVSAPGHDGEESLTVDLAAKVVDGDDHVVEPSDLWADRTPATFFDRVPRIVLGDDDLERLIVTIPMGTRSPTRLIWSVRWWNSFAKTSKRTSWAGRRRGRMALGTTEVNHG